MAPKQIGKRRVLSITAMFASVVLLLFLGLSAFWLTHPNGKVSSAPNPPRQVVAADEDQASKIDDLKKQSGLSGPTDSALGGFDMPKKSDQQIGASAVTLPKLLDPNRPTNVLKANQPGMVWADTDSKIYHKQGSQWYGDTKKGKWMSENDAQGAGYKAARARNYALADESESPENKWFDALKSGKYSHSIPKNLVVGHPQPAWFKIAGFKGTLPSTSEPLTGVGILKVSDSMTVTLIPAHDASAFTITANPSDDQPVKLVPDSGMAEWNWQITANKPMTAQPLLLTAYAIYRYPDNREVRTEIQTFRETVDVSARPMKDYLGKLASDHWESALVAVGSFFFGIFAIRMKALFAK